MTECLITPHLPSTEEMANVIKCYLLKRFIAWTENKLINLAIMFEKY